MGERVSQRWFSGRLFSGRRRQHFKWDEEPRWEGALLSPLPTADEAHARRRSGGAAQTINPHGRPLPPANHTAGAAGAPLPHPAREASARTVSS